MASEQWVRRTVHTDRIPVLEALNREEKAENGECDPSDPHDSVVGVVHLDIPVASSRHSSFLAAIYRSNNFGLRYCDETEHEEKDGDHVDHIGRCERWFKKSTVEIAPQGVAR